MKKIKEILNRLLDKSNQNEILTLGLTLFLDFVIIAAVAGIAKFISYVFQYIYRDGIINEPNYVNIAYSISKYLIACMLVVYVLYDTWLLMKKYYDKNKSFKKRISKQLSDTYLEALMNSNINPSNN